MKKGEQYTGRVEKLDFPNKGIVSLEDGKVVVKNVIPDQTISFVIQKKRKGKAQGRLVEVLERSPVEIDSSCPHFGTCGGCTYQNLPYEEQLKIKERQVKELLDSVYIKREEQPVYQFEGIKASPNQFAYRNKMEFSFGDERKDGPLSLGMHKRGSFYDVVSVEQCQMVDEDYRLILKTVLDYFQDKQISFYHRMKHTGCLRHLLVRKAVKTGEILIVLVTTTQEAEVLEGLLKGFTKTLLDLETDERKKGDIKKELPGKRLQGKIAGILHTKNDSLADVVKSDETVILYGKDYFYEELLGLKFKISPFSFFQTNSLGAEVLYETAREYIGKLDEGNMTDREQCREKGKRDKVVFDLYSGTGTIAQMLAPVAKKVIGVEIVEEAVEAARINAQQNELSNCEFIAGDVLKVLDDIEDKPDLIVLDPPRDGIHPKALQKIIAYGVERIVYISCKPTSLVRDLEVFLESGYEMVRASGVDMFPGTGHVETCVLLTHKKPTSYIEVTMDYDKIVPNQKPGRATYKMITEYVKEKYNLVVKSTTIAEVKRSFGLEVGDYNIREEKTNYRKEKITPEKRNAVEDALRHFGVIE